MTPLMRSIIEALKVLRVVGKYPATPNEIGSQVGVAPVKGGGRPGRGRGHRHFGDAQRIIFPLTALERRGLVAFGPRRDGLSGTAYQLTDAGERI